MPDFEICLDEAIRPSVLRIERKGAKGFLVVQIKSVSPRNPTVRSFLGILSNVGRSVFRGCHRHWILSNYVGQDFVGSLIRG